MINSEKYKMARQSYSRLYQFTRTNTKFRDLYFQEYKEDMVNDLELLEEYIKQLERRNMGLKTTNEHLKEKFEKLYR